MRVVVALMDSPKSIYLPGFRQIMELFYSFDHYGILLCCTHIDHSSYDTGQEFICGTLHFMGSDTEQLIHHMVQRLYCLPGKFNLGQVKHWFFNKAPATHWTRFRFFLSSMPLYCNSVSLSDHLLTQVIGMQMSFSKKLMIIWVAFQTF